MSHMNWNNWVIFLNGTMWAVSLRANISCLVCNILSLHPKHGRLLIFSSFLAQLMNYWIELGFFSHQELNILKHLGSGVSFLCDTFIGSNNFIISMSQTVRHTHLIFFTFWCVILFQFVLICIRKGDKIKWQSNELFNFGQCSTYQILSPHSCAWI